MAALLLRKIAWPLACLIGTLNFATVATGQLIDPASQPRFVNPLPAPPVLDARSGGTFAMTIMQDKKHLGLVHPVTKQPIMTPVWGYNWNGNTYYPGPTILAQKDITVNMFWYNGLKRNGQNLPHLLNAALDTSLHWALKGVPNWQTTAGVPIVTHLHGGNNESESDGLPDAWYTPDFSHKGFYFRKGDLEPYTYNNTQEAATIWYHDHALGITRLNVYAGLAGFYLLTDANEKAMQDNHQLPTGPYDLGLAIQDRLFMLDDDTARLHYTTDSHIAGNPAPSVMPEFFGNIILVNGMAWPVLEVEPRQYRFRLLNGSDSRFYNLHFSEKLKFWQIGSDAGFLPSPIAHDQLLMATGERKDVVVDFSDPNLWGKTIILRNNAKAPFPKGSTPNPKNEGQIMAFKVNKPLSSAPLTALPGTLRASALPNPNHDNTRKLILFEGTDEYGRLKAQLGTLQAGPKDYRNAITENPKLNETEIWEIYNLTPDAHPIHLHLVSFRVMSTQKFRPVYANASDEAAGRLSNVQLLGQPKAPDPGDHGLKDTYAIMPGEVARFKATFNREGLYAWHCHILSHEDHDMMRPYFVGDVIPDDLLAHFKNDDDHKTAKQDAKGLKDVYSLYPNPFAATANLQIEVTDGSDVSVRIYDLQGRLVKDVVNKPMQAGSHNLLIDGKDLSAGLYVCEIKMNQSIYREQIVLTK